MSMPCVEIIYADYENFDVECPHCNERIRYNRASDLNDLVTKSRWEVKCLNQRCQKMFAAIYDTGGPKWKMVLYDCERLKKEKRFIHCGLNLCQALEMFFSSYLHKKLLYELYSANRDIGEFEESESFLDDLIKNYTFSGLRKLFLHYVLLNRTFPSWSEVKLEISSIPKISHEPTNELIDQSSNPKIKELLERLKQVKTPQLRNDAVHKSAYRPTLEEINLVQDETMEILENLNLELDVYEDPYYYWVTQN